MLKVTNKMVVEENIVDICYNVNGFWIEMAKLKDLQYGAILNKATSLLLLLSFSSIFIRYLEK